MKKVFLLLALSTGIAVAQPATMQPDTSAPLGEGVHIQPIEIAPPPPKKDLRPVYMGVGLLLIGAAFWWNRRQREQFDRSDVTSETSSEPTVTKTDEDKA